MKPITLDTLKTRLRNNRSGSTGSEARLSTTTKAAISTTPSTASPMIVAERHG